MISYFKLYILGPSMSGRLKLNKAKFSENEKAAKAKAKKAEKKLTEKG